MKCIVLFGYLLWLLIKNCAVATETEVVRVFVEDEKELNALISNSQPHNIAAATNQLLFAKIKNAKVEFVGASHKKALHTMRSQSNAVCALNKVKNRQRLAEFSFSLPVNIYISRRLYHHSDAAPLAAEVLNSAGEIISLKKLFEVYPDKPLLLSDTISYGSFFDHELAQLPAQHKTYLAGRSYYQTVHRLFESRRVDFLLGFPVEVLQYGSKDQSLYRPYVVANSPKANIGFVMCNQHKASKALLAKIDQALKSLYTEEVFYKAHLHFLPKQDHEEINELIQQVTEINSFSSRLSQRP